MLAAISAFKNFTLLFSFALILFLLLKLVIIPWRTIKSLKKEGVTTHFFPVLGIFHLFNKSLKENGDFMGSCKTSSQETPHQKYMVTHIAHHPMFLLRDPQYFRDFLQNPHLYEKTDFTKSLKRLSGSGLAFSEGETWKKHRKIVSNSFHYEFLKANIHVIQETTKEYFDMLSTKGYKDFAAIPRIQEITGEIVGRTFFGKNLNKYTINGRPLTLELAEIGSQLSTFRRSPLTILFGDKVMDLPIFPKFYNTMKRIKQFRQVCFNIVKDRKEQSHQSNDLLASLLATQKYEDIEQRYSDEDIVNEFITFFVAGMDTTGHLIGMTIYNLSQYPQYLQQLKEERKQTYSKEREVTAETLSKMDVLHSLFKETLRFYPPGVFNFFRKATEDHKLLDLEIKKGQYITTDYTSVFFNEKYFPEPEKFDPSRWTKGDQKLDPYAFTPFSAGPRNCIGQHLAIMEAKVIMSEFLERFDFKLKEGYQLRMIIRFLYEPLDELLFDLIPLH